MENVFAKLYSNKIEDIHSFLKSDSNILYISGFSGSGKSSVLKSALKLYDKDILNFHHLCFKKTVTDDFLLSFYDTFRMYAIKQVISLKKNPEEEFVQKVNFYFKNIEHPAVVVIDNFESVDKDENITDLLIHISGFDNVKVIVISKNINCLLTENPTVSIARIDFEKIDMKSFTEIMASSFPDTPQNVLDNLYNAADGYELYVKMALTYISSIGVNLDEFMSEFERRETSFDKFVIEKQVSLIPTTYYPLLQCLAFIYHNVQSSFIETYSIGTEKQLQYLHSKFMISEFWETYYIKSYLRHYFSENTTYQNKVAICKKLIEIYENELKKSPKDRLLRMSRESIRNQISMLEEFLPAIKKVETTPVYNYIQNSVTGSSDWYRVGGANTANVSRLEALRQKSRQRKEEKKEQNAKQEKVKIESLFEKGIKQAEESENKYRYKDAVILLKDLKKEANTLDEKKILLSKLSSDLIKLNDNNSAINALKELCMECEKENDINSYSKYKIEIGKIYKKQYSFSRAKTCFMEIEEKENEIPKEILADAKEALGEIYELEENSDEAIKKYKAAFNLILETSKGKNPKLPDISYKLAMLYDENGYQDEALEEYNRTVTYSESSNNHSHLIKAYAGSGVIFADMGDTEHALSCFMWALELSKNSESHLDTYYIARNIADIYRNFEPEKSYDYLKMALEYAKLSNNSFEIAISELEMGDYYYNLKQNEQALICYFEAKKALGEAASKENIERVQTRINDMKIKLGDWIFNSIRERYERNN